MPLGMAVAGPIADAIGLHATLRAMSAIGLLAAALWLAQPATRRLRRPHAAPTQAGPTPEPAEHPIGAPL
jgi:cyanate permease